MGASTSSDEIKIAAKRGYTSVSGVDHLFTDKDEAGDFYKAQSCQELGGEDDRVQVPIWVDSSLDDDWK